MEAELFHADRQTDGTKKLDEADCLFSQFCDLA